MPPQQRPVSELSDEELLRALSEVRQRGTGAGGFVPTEQPLETPTRRFGRRFREMGINPLLKIGGAVGRSLLPAVTPSQAESRTEARKEVARLPVDIVRAQIELGQGGGRKIGEALVPGEPTPMSARVQKGVSGALDLAATPIPFGAAARVPGHLAEQGDVAGGFGALAGLAAPAGAGRALRAVPRPRPRQPLETVTLPNEQVVEVPTTRGEAGGLLARTIEPIARGSELAKGPFVKFEQRRADVIIDQVANEIARQVAPQVRTQGPSFAGQTMQRALRRGIEAVKDRAQLGLDQVEAAAADVPMRLDTFRRLAASELKKLNREMEVARTRGDTTAAAELRAAAGELSADLREIPESLRPAVEAQIAATEVSAIPADVAFRLQKKYARLARRVPERDPGISGGTSKRLAGALREDIEASLREADKVAGRPPNESLARNWNVENARFRRAVGRLEDKTFERVFAQNSEAVPEVLMQVDVRQIPRLKVAAGKDAFDTSARALLQENINNAIMEETTIGPRVVRARQLAPSPLKTFVKNLERDGRGLRIYGPGVMTSLRQLVDAAETAAESQRVGAASIIARSVDSAATLRLGSAAVGATVGATAAGPSGAAVGALAGGLAPAALLRLSAGVLVRPKGAGLLRNALRSTGNAARQAFWLTRLGEFIQSDEELRALAAGQGLPTTPQPVMGLPGGPQRVQLPPGIQR